LARQRSGRLFAVLAGVFAIVALALAGTNAACNDSSGLITDLLWPGFLILAAIFTGLAIGSWLVSGKPRRRVARVFGSVVAAIVTGVVIVFLSLGVGIERCVS